jgi:hypothetical protein
MSISHSSVDGEKPLVIVSWVYIFVQSAECFPALNSVKNCLPTSQWCPRSKRMCLTEAVKCEYEICWNVLSRSWENASSICTEP